MYYKYTIARIREELADFEPKLSETGEQSPEHVLAMCDEVQGLREFVQQDATKAARWIGWMVAAMENLCDSWTNQVSRDLIRRDKEAGFTETTMYRCR